MKTLNSWSSILLILIFIGSAVGSRSVTNLQFSRQIGVCNSMVELKGYSCEEHKVTTQDGYILSLQRVSSRTKGELSNMPPVFLQHGLIVDGSSWLLMPPESSLALSLVDHGYQVWIANTRGTQYSQGHIVLNPDEPDYWDWSWDQLVLYDVPATLQYAYNHSGQCMHYIGHSLGTLLALAAFSNHRWMKMLRSAVLLSPIAFMSHITSVPSRVSADVFIAEATKFLGFAEFDPKGTGAVVELLAEICDQPGVDCTNLPTAFAGQHCCLNASVVADYLRYELQPTSTKTYIHLAQMVRSGTIKMYDYFSMEGNIKHYGQPTPPVYDMRRIPKEFPLFIGFGGADSVADVFDVELLLQELRHHRSDDKLVVHYLADYAHGDFIMSVRTKEDLSDPILAFFKRIDQNNVSFY